MYVCVEMDVCVCVRERERERANGAERGRHRIDRIDSAHQRQKKVNR